MKRKLLFTFITATSLLFSCSKDKKDATQTQLPTSNVEISEAPDTLHMTLGTSSYVPLLIKQLSGNNEQITLSSSGFPAKIKIAFTPDSGLATFETLMNVEADKYASEGYFKGNIIAKNKAGALKSKALVIHTYENCLAYVYGRWLRTIKYADGSTEGPSNAYLTVNGPYTSDGFGLNYYNFDCASGKVTLIHSEFSEYKGSEIYGTGTVSKSKITINGSIRYNSTEPYEPIAIEYTPN